LTKNKRQLGCQIVCLTTRVIEVKNVIFFSVVQEAMKRILKQKSHPYEVSIKPYKVIKSHIFHVRS